MAEFIIKTSDNVYTYSNTLPATVKQKWKSNHILTNTQGYLIKKQSGNQRVEMDIVINGESDTNDNINNNLLPQLNYPQSVIVTIDRNILGKIVKSCEFIIADYDVSEELADGNEQVVKMKLIEVI